ncbi:MAG: hypothetical protein U1F64_01310 [Burkholderiales bacterium]
MAEPEVGAVAFEQPDLLVGEHQRFATSGRFQAQQSLVACFQVMAQPHPAHPRWAHGDALEPQVVGHPRRPARGELEAIAEDAFLDLGCDAIGMRIAGTALLFDQRSDAPGLKGTAHFIKAVAMEAHDLGGLGDVAEFLGELQQRQFAFDTLSQSGHWPSPEQLTVWRSSIYPEDPVAARLPLSGSASSQCRKITKRTQTSDSLH